MDKIIEKIMIVLRDSTLRRRIIFTIAILAITRLLATIPVPGVDVIRLQNFFAGNQFLGLLNIFSGGGLSTLSIVMLGVGPYITASIIMQLLTLMSSKLKAMYQEEGEAGRKKFTQYSRLLTLPLALVQGFGFVVLLQNQGILSHLNTFGLVTNVLVIAVGSIIMMWLGELITEFGIGNGASIIIFAGIVSRIPTVFNQFISYQFNAASIPTYLAFLAVTLVVIFGVVVITEAERPIPVTYAKRVRGMKVYGGISTYLPLRLNQSGVIPIIFALSILLFPQMILGFLAKVSNPLIQSSATTLNSLLANNWIHAVLYFVLVFLFTYFYTAVTFDPDSIADNLQKNGAFIPGVRPGQSTVEYISKILTRLTLVGASFLGIVAVLPLVMTAFSGSAVLAIGGTALLIVVSVVIDLINKINAQVTMREY